MIKKLESKPIFVSSNEEIETLKSEYRREQKLNYACSACGKISTSNLRILKLPRICSMCKAREPKNLSDDVKLEMVEKQKKTIIEKYGSLEAFHKIVSEKSKKTCFERYGVENAGGLQESLEKAKQTWQNNYGVDNPFQLENVKEKIKQMNLKKYGVENVSQSEDVKEKIKRTNLQKYGVECVLQSDEIRDKGKKTSFEKYGNSVPQATEQIKEKVRNTNKLRFGSDYATQSESIKEKIKNTCSQKYGTEFAISSEYVRSKIEQTCINRFGAKSFVESELHKERMLERYGTLCVPSYRYMYNDILFDSTWELAFYIFHIDMNHNISRVSEPIEYVFSNKQHLYFPDFEIDGQLYEIKGDQFFKKDGTMCCPYNHLLDGLFEAKHQCGLRNNVIFLRKNECLKYLKYVENKYGKGYLKSFCIRNTNIKRT